MNRGVRAYVVLLCVLAMSSLLTLSGCETTTLGKKEAMRDKGMLAMDRLPPQTLKTGECGLFVWTSDSAKRFILFAQNSTEKAVWVHNGEKINLIRTHASGLSIYEQYPEQDFTGPEGQTISLRLTEGNDLDMGMRFPEGRLRLVQNDGWEMVVPVVAMATCETR